MIALLMLPCLLFAKNAISQDNDDLTNYIKRLRADYAGPRNETGFLSAGSAFLYAQDYFDAKNYSAASNYFAEVLQKEKDNPYANYQLAISLIRQKNESQKQKAEEYLEHAFRLNSNLKERYKTDVAANDIPANNLTGDKTIQKNKEQQSTNTGGLQNYISRLKKSRAEGGGETAMNTSGQRALYGIEYYEANEYMSAETDLILALARDPDNPYINYLLAVSTAAQGKKEDAKNYLQKAIKGDPSVAVSYNNDVARATAKWKALVEKRKIKPAPVAQTTPGGGLILSNYTCNQTIWNGPNVSPAYRYQYKGYIILKAGGTYSWVGNGESGRYSYDPKTGNITWLSGYFKTVQAKNTQYQLNKETTQITINFSDSYRWECGCNKK